jgi:aminoglycoside 3-N-acetyltransferase
MKEIILFKDKGFVLSNKDLFNSLVSIGANECDTLYIHTSLNFGSPNPQLRKSQILELLAEVIFSLNVKTLILPSYTFSFCNNEIFDVNNTKSPMGILNEYIRLIPGTVRSNDPLMSNILIGKDKEFVENIGNNSVGKDSTFDLLHKSKDIVKFLFLGPRLGDCFTYMHFIEAIEKVPYRFYYDFEGTVVDKNKLSSLQRFSLFVRYKSVLPGGGSYVYENILREKDIAKSVPFGASKISIVEKSIAHSVYLDLLKLSPSFFINEPFEDHNLDKAFDFRKMVAL